MKDEVVREFPRVGRDEIILVGKFREWDINMSKECPMCKNSGTEDTTIIKINNWKDDKIAEKTYHVSYFLCEFCWTKFKKRYI